MLVWTVLYQQYETENKNTICTNQYTVGILLWHNLLLVSNYFLYWNDSSRHLSHRGQYEPDGKDEVIVWCPIGIEGWLMRWMWGRIRILDWWSISFESPNGIVGLISVRQLVKAYPTSIPAFVLGAEEPLLVIYHKRLRKVLGLYVFSGLLQFHPLIARWFVRRFLATSFGM